jgi:hypothetical protein
MARSGWQLLGTVMAVLYWSLEPICHTVQALGAFVTPLRRCLVVDKPYLDY